MMINIPRLLDEEFIVGEWVEVIQGENIPNILACITEVVMDGQSVSHLVGHMFWGEFRQSSPVRIEVEDCIKGKFTQSLY